MTCEHVSCGCCLPELILYRRDVLCAYCCRYNRILVTSESVLGFMGQNIKIQAFKAVELFIKSNQCMFAGTWWVQALMKNSKAMKNCSDTFY